MTAITINGTAYSPSEMIEAIFCGFRDRAVASGVFGSINRVGPKVGPVEGFRVTLAGSGETVEVFRRKQSGMFHVFRANGFEGIGASLDDAAWNAFNP